VLGETISGVVAMRFFRFRLKSLFIVFTILAVYLGIETIRVTKQRKALAIVQKLGGQLFYDYQIDPQNDYRRIQGTISPRGPAWLRAIVGDDYFRTAIELDLIRVSAGDEELGKLSSLLPGIRLLRLDRAVVTDEGLRSLESFNQLEFLSLNNTGVTDAGLRSIAKCTNLRHLELRAAPVSDEGLGNLENLTRLESLTLDLTAVTDAGMVYIAKHTNLRNLQLTRTQVTDEGLKSLSALQNLEMLGLAHTAVTDEGLDAVLVASQQSLHWVNLQNTQVGDECVPHLMALRSLDFINVKGTNVSDYGLADIRGRFPKCVCWPSSGLVPI
jgi:hypothetical protein